MKPNPPPSKTKTAFLFPGQMAAIFAIIFSLAQPCESVAQSETIPPVPPPDLSVAPPVDIRPAATITFSNSKSVWTRGVKGQFRLVDLRPHEVVNVRLRFPASFADVPMVATTLDGGEVALHKHKSVIDPDGTASFRFTGGEQPGLYRVLVTAGGSESILQFWIADRKNPKANPAALRPRD